MKFLVLWGTRNHGKTQTLNLLAVELGAVCAEIKKDAHYIIPYNNKIIAITTKGDDEQSLKNEFKSLPTNADLYICASRTKGSAVKYIEKCAAKDEIYWLSKTSLSLEQNGQYNDSVFLNTKQNYLNQTQAKEMKKIIDAFISNGII